MGARWALGGWADGSSGTGRRWSIRCQRVDTREREGRESAHTNGLSETPAQGTRTEDGPLPVPEDEGLPVHLPVPLSPKPKPKPKLQGATDLGRELCDRYARVGRHVDALAVPRRRVVRVEPEADPQVPRERVGLRLRERFLHDDVAVCEEEVCVLLCFRGRSRGGGGRQVTSFRKAGAGKQGKVVGKVGMDHVVML